MIEIYSGSLSVFASGFLFSFRQADEFKLLIKPTKDFEIKLHIQVREDGGKRRLDKTVKGNDMYLECLNFGAGAGTIEPLEIATANGKKMYIHFWIETVDDTKLVRSLRYTIYLEV